MTSTLRHALLHAVPEGAWPGLWTRGGIVWLFALFIALFNWHGGSKGHSLDVAFVYTYAISTSIWLLTDLLRFPLRGWLRSPAPHYWPQSWRAALWLVFGIALGYTIGTAIGDAYTGHSTWDLLYLDPQRFMALMVSSAGISLGFLGYFYLRGRAESLQRQASEAQLKLLESQLEPHMLFNTLANLRALIGTDPDRAIAMLDQLNRYLRATLSASRHADGERPHTLNEEFARLQDYLDLMKVRMGNRLQYHLQCPSDLVSTPIPPFLLQPLVENALRHGLEPSISGGRVDVTVQTDQGRLELQVRDNGVGFAGTHSPGFGISQVQERLKTVFGPRGQMAIKSAPGEGTTIIIHMPWEGSTARR
ncbi:MAG TPA: sensor histidine kinase [Hydrogenophaga sp.]|nr:sensor histidine kinase [Hydrogenophaga sp.]